MKTVYISHSSSMDYKKLYSELGKIEGVKFIFPHAKSKRPKNSKFLIKKCSLVIADVSKPSHGVGIELGWAHIFGVPIIFIFKQGAKPSSSLKLFSRKFIKYKRFDELKKLEKMLV